MVDNPRDLRKRVTYSLHPGIIRQLEELADLNNRSFSNMLEWLVKVAYERAVRDGFIYPESKEVEPEIQA